MPDSTKTLDCRVGFSPPIPILSLRAKRSNLNFIIRNSLFDIGHSIFTTTFAFLLLLFLIAAPAQAKYGGGTGEPNDPYLIYTAEQMNEIGLNEDDWDKCFKLIADIDLSAYTGTEFNIIGKWVAYPFEDESNPFIGVFDGDNHTISNFTRSSIGRDGIGLFGYVGEGGQIQDLGLENVNIDSGNADHVGGLIGYNQGSIVGCYSTGYVSGNLSIGGLVGFNIGTISDCYSAAHVSGYWYVGGLAGRNYYGTITNCYSSGSVLGSYHIGGMVGGNNSRNGVIINCYSTASVSGNGAVGGLVGTNSRATIANCYSTGSVTGTEERVGGLVGSSGYVNSSSWGTVRVSFWDVESSGQLTSAGGIGKTTAEMKTAGTFFGWGGCDDGGVWTIDEGNDYPRLLWEFKPGQPLPKLSDLLAGSGTESDPYMIYTAEQLNTIGLAVCNWEKHFKLMADINLSGYTEVEFNIIGCAGLPFIGIFDGNDYKVSNFTWNSEDVSYVGLFAYVGSKGHIKNLGLENVDVNIVNGSYGGGLVGDNEGTITDCYSTGIVTAEDSEWGRIGGLVGTNGGTITNCYSIGTVSGRWIIGGLAGDNSGTISDCWATASATGNGYVGGLVGEISFGTITSCVSSATVSGKSNVGGLAGHNWMGTITASYSSGSVRGEESGWGAIGGLVGYNERGWVSDCYSTANVSGGNFVGGLVGKNDREITDSFWDIETSEQTTSAGGTGKTTAEMQTESTFTDAGWDFTTPVWTIDEGADYPRLWWETPVLHAEPEVTLGTSNTISWDPVIGAIEYYAECAEDSNFTSILYASGWITETSCEFTGLQLGQRYWYSVKARNSAGTETGWSNVESSLQVTLADAVEIMLDPDTLKNKNLKNALINKINTVLEMLDEGFYADALNKLRNDILQKTDGCAQTGRPDKNDWIITCEGQSVFYPLVIETIEYVKGLMNQ